MICDPHGPNPCLRLEKEAATCSRVFLSLGHATLPAPCSTEHGCSASGCEGFNACDSECDSWATAACKLRLLQNNQSIFRWAGADGLTSVPYCTWRLSGIAKGTSDM